MSTWTLIVLFIGGATSGDIRWDPWHYNTTKDGFGSKQECEIAGERERRLSVSDPGRGMFVRYTCVEVKDGDCLPHERGRFC